MVVCAHASNLTLCHTYVGGSVLMSVSRQFAIGDFYTQLVTFTCLVLSVKIMAGQVRC